MSAALSVVPGVTDSPEPAAVDPIQPEDYADDLHNDVEALFLCALLWAPRAAAQHAIGILEPTDFVRPSTASSSP